MTKKISQREARALKKRVADLEARDKGRLNVWKDDYPGGANICLVKLEPSDYAVAAIRTARLLEHYVVVTTRTDGTLSFYAVSK